MNTHKMKLFGFFATLFLLVPASSEAYFTTGQTATRLTADTILYSVSYAFGFADRELYMPIMAMRSSGTAMQQHLTEFSIVTNDTEVVNAGLSNGLVLTGSKDVEIKNGQYYLEPGEKATFTLVTLLSIPKEQQTDDKLSLLVTQLPFTMIKDGKKTESHLNPSELQYYRTPAVSF